MGNCYYSIWYEFDSNVENPTVIVDDAPTVEDIMTAFGFDSLSEFKKFDASYNVLRRAGKDDNEAMSELLPHIAAKLYDTYLILFADALNSYDGMRGNSRQLSTNS